MADALENDAFTDGLEAAKAGSPAGTHEATDGPQASAAEGSLPPAPDGGAGAEGAGAGGGPAPTKVAFVRDYCVRARGASCERCVLACPVGAIAFDEDGNASVDGDACTNCGICLGICDGFSSTRVTMADLYERLRRIALRGEDVVLTCKEIVFPGLEPAANVVVLPCLATLSPEFWTLALAENIPVKVACDLSYCADCDRAGEVAETLYSHAIETAEKWTRKRVGFIDTIPEKEQFIKDLANPVGVDRRSAFTNLVGDVGDIASGKRRLRNSEVLHQFYERRERARALTRLNLGDAPDVDFVPEGQVKKTLMPKRQLLLQAIERDPSIAKRVNVALPRIDCERCENALACVGACPTGALSPLPEPGCVQLDARHCIGCGLCVDACPHEAIELVATTAEAFLGEDKEQS